MYPYGFFNDETEQLRQAKAHARMLMDEWRAANWPGAGRRAGVTSSGPLRRALKRVRRVAGGILIALGRRLLRAEGGRRPVVVAARRADGGC